MNLQQAMVKARHLNYAQQSIINIGKLPDSQYYVLALNYDEEENWYALQYEASHIPANGVGDDFVYAGENYDQLHDELKQHYENVDALQFEIYNINADELIDHEMSFVLHKLLPQIVPTDDLLTSYKNVTNHIDSYLAKQSQHTF